MVKIVNRYKVEGNKVKDDTCKSNWDLIVVSKLTLLKVKKPLQSRLWSFHSFLEKTV